VQVIINIDNSKNIVFSEINKDQRIYEIEADKAKWNFKITID